MANFKKETINAIIESRHKLEDVMFIGSYSGKKRMLIDKFLEASDFNYDNGYGASKIYTDLIVYFTDETYMTRGEYDGSEWWEYNKPLKFSKCDMYETFNEFKLGMWGRLDED